MRLLINATTLLKNPRGVGVYTKNILNHWSTEEINTEVLLPKASFQEIHQPSLKLIKAPSIEKHLLRLAWLQKLSFQKSMQIYDALHSTVPEIPFRLKIPYFITVHDLIALHYPNFVSKKYYTYFKYVMPKALAKAKGIITISENTKNDLLKLYPGLAPEKILVAWNGVDHHFFFPRNNINEKDYDWLSEPFFLCVGHFDHHKNIPFLIRSFSKVANRIPQKLVIVGRDENNLFSSVEKEILENKVSDRVIRLENVSNETLANFYTKADALLFPSLYEGFGLPILEAMACGCPIVSSNRSSMPEIIENFGILCDPNDEDQWIHAMIEINQTEKKDQLKELSLQKAQQFRWTETTKKIANWIFEKLK